MVKQSILLNQLLIRGLWLKLKKSVNLIIEKVIYYRSYAISRDVVFKSDFETKI